jgi:hypothetical protein
MICNPSESSPSILVRGGLRLGGHDKVGMAGDMEMARSLVSTGRRAAELRALSVS